MKSFKTTLQLICIVCISITFMACPISTNYPIVLEKNALPFNKTLIGDWKADSDGSGASRITIEKWEDKTYKVTVTEKGEMYSPESDKMKGWLCKLDNNTYFVLQEFDEATASWKDKYYFFEIKWQNNTITTREVSLKKDGIDAVQSVETFQKEVRASSTMEGFLADQSVWTRQ